MKPGFLLLKIRPGTPLNTGEFGFILCHMTCRPPCCCCCCVSVCFMWCSNEILLLWKQRLSVWTEHVEFGRSGFTSGTEALMKDALQLHYGKCSIQRVSPCLNPNFDFYSNQKLWIKNKCYFYSKWMKWKALDQIHTTVPQTIQIFLYSIWLTESHDECLMKWSLN